ncbi:MAG: Bug family tripartite tricarboxylate transporter substrate binding protein [Thermodesulfobacteriota bacterium]
MKRQVFWLSILFFLLSFLLSPRGVLAAPYFEGKRIVFLVGVGPGGGYDRMARLFAKHLPKYIPGKPNIVIENMPGAASILAANQVYNISKPDGLTIAVPQRGMPFAQILKVEGVRFDVTKFSWVGSTAVEGTAFCLRTDLPYKTFEDVLKTKPQLMVGGTGPGESSTQFCVLVKEFLGVSMKMVFYPSSPDVMLAVERKEVDGRAGSYTALKPFIERGLVRPLLRGRVAEAGTEKLPVDEDLTTDKMGKTLMAMRSSVEFIGRPFVAPPGTPANIMNILRDGFAKTAKDPELIADAKKNMMEVQYTSAEDCLKLVTFLVNQPADIIKEFSKYVKF